MPIFHDIERPFLSRSPPALESGGYGSIMRRSSKDSIRTEFCDGSVPDADGKVILPLENVVAAISDTKLETSDRAELIERIKRGESPTWIPTGTVSQIFPSMPLNAFVTADIECSRQSMLTRVPALDGADFAFLLPDDLLCSVCSRMAFSSDIGSNTSYRHVPNLHSTWAFQLTLSTE